MEWNLKMLRAKNGWTQAETAAKLGISTQTYNAWERNFGMVKYANAHRVAKLFGVRTGDIFFEERLEK